MTIEAYRKGEPCKRAIEAAVTTALNGLLEVAKHRETCSTWIKDIQDNPENPLPVTSMIHATRSVHDEMVTPMAAVAGTIAELSANSAYQEGATLVICNNGGDIALRMDPGECVTVGINKGLKNRTELSGKLKVDSTSGIRGICTSGLGGRSLTCGIAQSVTVLGAIGSVADVAATLIANHVSAEHPNISRKPAEELQPDTDIAGLLVTESVGELPLEIWKSALQHGVLEAERLLELGVISAAVLHVGPLRATIPNKIPGLEFA
ncbi:hypothetical protein V7124_13155 [Neobacillus niacini]|uniref:hypothetical protein n=1 Tax=Neobacillus niacini TaxID=86668 RepID=UPI002FFFA24F